MNFISLCYGGSYVQPKKIQFSADKLQFTVEKIQLSAKNNYHSAQKNSI